MKLSREIFFLGTPKILRRREATLLEESQRMEGVRKR
jgi:hypothetical protein